MANDSSTRVLRVSVQGPLTAAQITGGFDRLNRAYAAVLTHERLYERVIQLAASTRPDVLRDLREEVWGERAYRDAPPWYPWYRSWPQPYGPIWFDGEPLVVLQLHFASPGFSIFSGAGGPLETLRKTIQDRHERRKDREWREDLDRQQQEGEIDLRRREEEKVEAERREIAARAGRDEVELFRQKYELLKEFAGVDAARKWAAQELGQLGPVIDTLEGDDPEEPRLLDAPPAPPEDQPRERGTDQPSS